MTGCELIAQERARQIEKEGWTPSHDDEHIRHELAWAARCYLAEAIQPRNDTFIPGDWPWREDWWKPTAGDPVRDLVKAGALIAAEIDRLQRKSA